MCKIDFDKINTDFVQFTYCFPELKCRIFPNFVRKLLFRKGYYFGKKGVK